MVQYVIILNILVRMVRIGVELKKKDTNVDADVILDLVLEILMHIVLLIYGKNIRKIKSYNTRLVL